MRRLLRIGDLVLPPDTVTSTLIAFGGKGSGKTVFGAVLAEELSSAGLRWAWLDPLGVGYGLRYAENGSGKGVECLILGGAHGDIPISPDAGAAVADIVVEEPGNVLVDFSRKPSGEMWGIGEKIRFATAYARRLFQRQGDLVGGKRREPLMQFLDEGARYIPQVVPAGNPGLAESVSAWQQLVEEGRNVGIGVCILTQRSARISKDVAELADAMFAFRTVGPRSLDAVLDWLGDHVEKGRVKELSAEVRKLPRGSALVVSPGWLEVEKVVAIRMRRTFDSSATPKPGERPRHVRGDGAKPNIERIRAKMTEIIERAKQDDPKALRAELALLKKELERAKSAKPAATPVKDAPAPKLGEFEIAVDGRHLKKIVEACEAFEAQAESFEKPLRELRLAANLAHGAVRHARQTGPAALAKRLAKASLPSSSAASKPATAAVVREVVRDLLKTSEDVYLPKYGKNPLKEKTDDKTLPKGERTVLIAIAQHPDGVTREQITQLTGYKRSTRDLYIQHLRADGFVDEDLRATDAGREALGPDFDPLPTGHALYEYWIDRLSRGEASVLEKVACRYPEIVPREEISDATGYKRSTRDLYIQHLATRKLVTTPPSGVRLAETLVG